jgi:hypothetical protein
MRRGYACGMHARNAYEVLIGKLEGRRPLRRLGNRWKDNIKMDFLNK